MNETRETLLPKLNYAKGEIYQLADILAQYIELERNFKCTQSKVDVSGVKKKTKLLSMTIIGTLAGFYFILNLMVAGIMSLVPYLICGAVIYAYRGRKSVLKLFAFAFLSVQLVWILMVFIDEMNFGMALLMLLLVGAVIAVEYYVITYKNKNIDRYNEKVVLNNNEVEMQRMTLYNQYKTISEELVLNTKTWYPPKYYCIEAIDFFIEAVINFRADSVEKMVNLFVATEHNNKMAEFAKQGTQTLEMIKLGQQVLIDGQQQLIIGQQQILKEVKYANLLNVMQLFQLGQINSSVKESTRENRSFHETVYARMRRR